MTPIMYVDDTNLFMSDKSIDLSHAVCLCFDMSG